MRADNIEEQKSSVAVRYQRANGYAHGDVYGVQVTKKDEAGKALAGAEFTEAAHEKRTTFCLFARSHGMVGAMTRLNTQI